MRTRSGSINRTALSGAVLMLAVVLASCSEQAGPVPPPPPAAQPVIDVLPASRAFGQVQIGEVAHVTFIVTNVGDGRLVGSARASSPFHVVSGGSYDLGVGDWQRVEIAFTPTDVGPVTGVATFSGGGG